MNLTEFLKGSGLWRKFVVAGLALVFIQAVLNIVWFGGGFVGGDSWAVDRLLQFLQSFLYPLGSALLLAGLVGAVFAFDSQHVTEESDNALCQQCGETRNASGALYCHECGRPIGAKPQPELDGDE